MIFEGTKNQFFFGLGLTRAGASIPDLNKILQLSELFSVSTDFLLKEDQEDFSQFQKYPEYEYEEENELPFMESEVSQKFPITTGNDGRSK